MKHHVNIIFLGLFLNLCYGTPSGSTTPTFSLSEERSFDGSPKINIVFANGKSDTMILTKFDNDEEEEPPIEDKMETEAEDEECRYLGHLENEPSACIAMAGCPGVENVEFTIFSKNVFDSPAYVWTKEGSVKMIKMENSHYVQPFIRDDNDTYVPPEPVNDNETYVPEPMPMEEDRGVTSYIANGVCDGGNNNPDYKFDGGDCCVAASQKKGKDKGRCKGNDCLCKTMRLVLKIGYGSGFKSKFTQGSKPSMWGYIKKALVLAQPYFCHESLGHRIKLDYSNYIHFWKSYPGHNFRTNDLFESQDPNKHKHGIWNHDEVLDLVEKDLGGADLMVLFGYDENDFSSNGQFLGGSTGVAYPNQVCRQNTKKYKWSINEWRKSPAAIASTIAHEIGHNLGMQHDHDQADKSCNCKGVMSYDKHCSSIPVAWSPCSKADFIKHFNSQKEHWCMDNNPKTKYQNCGETECKDSQPASWNNYWGKLCEKYVIPNNYCDKTWGKYCDYKKCGEFCKKSCNKC